MVIWQVQKGLFGQDQSLMSAKCKFSFLCSLWVYNALHVPRSHAQHNIGLCNPKWVGRVRNGGGSAKDLLPWEGFCLINVVIGVYPLLPDYKKEPGFYQPGPKFCIIDGCHLTAFVTTGKKRPCYHLLYTLEPPSLSQPRWPFVLDSGLYLKDAI